MISSYKVHEKHVQDFTDLFIYILIREILLYISFNDKGGQYIQQIVYLILSTKHSTNCKCLFISYLSPEGVIADEGQEIVVLVNFIASSKFILCYHSIAVK